MGTTFLIKGWQGLPPRMGQCYTEDSHSSVRLRMGEWSASNPLTNQTIPPRAGTLMSVVLG